MIKFKSEFYVFGWFPGLQNLDVFLKNLLQSKFSGKNNSLQSPDLGFYDSLPYDLEKSKELRALISWFLGL